MSLLHSLHLLSTDDLLDSSEYWPVINLSFVGYLLMSVNDGCTVLMAISVRFQFDIFVCTCILEMDIIRGDRR